MKLYKRNKNIINNKIKIDKDYIFIYPNDEWILDIDCYFSILENINIKLIRLLKYKSNDYKKIENIFLELSNELNRIIPIKNKNINPADGILELKKYFDYLLNDYNELFSDYKDQLLDINLIRHKYEHAAHTIKMNEYLSTSKNKKINFIYFARNKFLGIGFGKGSYSIDTDDLINIVTRLNNIFIKIKGDFYKAVEKRKYDVSNKNFVSIVNLEIEKFNEKLLSRQD